MVRSAFVAIVLATLLGACDNSEKAANQLLIEATELYERAARTAASDASAAFRTMTEAEAKLHEIIQRYPTSKVAAGLASERAGGKISMGAVEGARARLAFEACRIAPEPGCLTSAALAMAAFTEQPYRSTLALSHVAVAQFAAGETIAARLTLQRAHGAAGRIRDPLDRFEPLLGLARAEIALGNKAAAEKLVKSMKADVDRLGPDWKEIGQSNLSEGLYLLGDVEGGLATAPKIEHRGLRMKVLLEGAGAHLRASMPDRADQAFREGLEVARSEPDASRRADNLCQAAEALVESGRVEEALRVADEALLAARETRDRYRSCVLRVLLAAGAIDKARAFADQSERRDHRAKVEIAVARDEAKRGDKAAALARLAGLIESAKDFDYLDRGSALHGSALAMVEIGEIEAARPVIGKLSAFDRGEVLVAIAKAYAAAGNKAAATAAAAELLDTAPPLDGGDDDAELERIAERIATLMPLLR